WIAFGIVDAALAEMQPTGLRDNRPVRIELLVAALNLGEGIHLHTNMMQPHVHARLHQRIPPLEKRKVEEPIGQSDVAIVRTANLLEIKVARVEARERGWVVAQISNVADASLHFRLPHYFLPAVLPAR